MQTGPRDRRLRTPASPTGATGPADDALLGTPLAQRFNGLTSGMAEQFRVRASESVQRALKSRSVRPAVASKLDNLP